MLTKRAEMSARCGMIDNERVNNTHMQAQSGPGRDKSVIGHASRKWSDKAGVGLADRSRPSDECGEKAVVQGQIFRKGCARYAE